MESRSEFSSPTHHLESPLSSSFFPFFPFIHHHPNLSFPASSNLSPSPNQIAHGSRQNSSVSHLIVHYSCRLRLFRKPTHRKPLLTRPHATPCPGSKTCLICTTRLLDRLLSLAPFASSTPSTTSIESTNNLQSSLNTVPPDSTLSLVLPLVSVTL